MMPLYSKQMECSLLTFLFQEVCSQIRSHCTETLLLSAPGLPLHCLLSPDQWHMTQCLMSVIMMKDILHPLQTGQKYFKLSEQECWAYFEGSDLVKLFSWNLVRLWNQFMKQLFTAWTGEKELATNSWRNKTLTAKCKVANLLHAILVTHFWNIFCDTSG